MRVQRCPACGARYNVERLDPGVSFECRRCHEMVVVGEVAPPRRGASLGLVVGGLVTIGAVFLYANPLYGASRAEWPWDLYISSQSLLLRATFLLWTATGVAAVLMGLVPRARGRGVVLAAAAVWLLVLVCAGMQAGFWIRADHPLPWMMGLIGVTVCMELVRSGRPGLTARVLGLGGALCLVWWHLNGFTNEAGREQPLLAILVRDLGLALQGRLGEVTEARERYVWEALASTWCILATCGLAFLVSLGVRARWIGLVGLLVLVIGMLLPVGVALGEGLSETSTFDQAMKMVTKHTADGLVHWGIAMWILVTWSITDLVPSSEGAS